ncbi:ABC transporter substrate-binding protein [Desulfomonile tiedjei]|uniref:ABC-type nitrate/sulfonate/bicarbonate transport system, periplasmic component n=1 Tax=Desulfomonile tiedjei (strain ATCC 49306 / DSM 6799 / DCB-1) TaxID=706587 RepID=I4C9B1_DESTA|nr:ABC transporter substrate-binding protein [Desulfomonile tiedjei]AFM26152.1 ABC-type nitrate/sulfonate/bicarbonate transport system, periplasmic component [Desulfomonile tiedjei DSM 6799]
MNRHHFSGILLLFLSVISLACLYGCDASQPNTKAADATEKLVISTYPGDHSALLWIAEKQGYFSARGVDVRLEIEESGLASLRQVFAGKAGLATVSEFVFVSNISEHPELRVLSAIGQTRDVRLVARKDHDITEISDLRNKRIGVVRSTVADYFFHLFLMFHRIPRQEIHIVDLTPSEQIKAIAKGEIDAAVTWANFAKEMENTLGDKMISWPAQSEQDYYWLLVGTNSTLERQSSEIKKILSALDAADDFLHNHRDEALRILVSKLGPHHIPEVWENSSFDLSLSRPFVLAMEAELRWMKSSQGVQEFEMPDLLDFIHFGVLQSVRPEKVQMLH